MRHWDPDCWLAGETYYAISGGRLPHLMKSSDLRDWEYVGNCCMTTCHVGRAARRRYLLPQHVPYRRSMDVALLEPWIGSRYYLGHFQDERFLPDSHGRMNWMCAFQGGDEDADLFAPESLQTPDDGA